VTIHRREAASVLRENDPERPLFVRRMIVASSEAEREADLDAWAAFNGFEIPAVARRRSSTLPDR
jgi:hypothetical protein